MQSPLGVHDYLVKSKPVQLFKQAGKKIIIMGRLLPLPLVLVLLLAPVKLGYADDYFFTQSAYFGERRWVSFFIDFHQYLKQNKAEVNQYLLQALPLKIKTTLVKNVEASLMIPLVFGRDYLNARELPATLGNIEFELRFAQDDAEYDYRQAYYFKYRVGTGVPTQKPPKSIEDANGNISATYYPLTSSLEEMTLGWHASKNLSSRSQLHFNFNYTYQFTNHQGITNLARFENFISDEVETNARGGKLTSTRFSLFGLDHLLRQLFWTTSLNDPWSDKRNDYLTFSLTVDFYLATDYYFGRKKILLGLKPFFEFTGVLPFSEESFYLPRVVLIPGLFLKFTKHFHYLFGLGIGSAEQHFSFEQVAFMSLRIVL